MPPAAAPADPQRHPRPGPVWGVGWGVGWAVVVPAGGRGSRLGGADKPALVLGGRGLLERLLDGLPTGVPAALVGPVRPLALAVERPLLWCREEPAGGGPAAAVAAGAAALHAGAPASGGPLDVVVVLPGDAPHAAAAVPALLGALAAAPDAAAAVAVDAGGRRQVLVAAHRARALAERAAELTGRGGPDGLAGAAAARLLPPAGALVEVPVGEEVLADVDSPGDLERLEGLLALRRAGRRGPA